MNTIQGHCMNYLIYKITNKVNGKVYIGAHKTKDINDGYMGSGDLIKAAINKYGVGNFEKIILHNFDNSEDMFAKEASIVNAGFIKSKNTYNVKEGGFGGWQYVHSAYWTTEKRSKSQMGRTVTQETRCKISKLHKGKTVSQETKDKISKSTKGKVFSEETLKKMSEAKKGKPLSKEHKEKMSKAHKSRKKVTCIHCSKTIPVANHKQWHGDNCKQKED